MTRATNYLKARFPSVAAATRALPGVEAFVRQGMRAHVWWQTHRALERKGQRSVFWQQFKGLFPEVYGYLGLKAGSDCDGGLTGFLEFGRQEIELRVEGCFLLYRAEVWHWADWDLLAEYLQKKFQAEGVAWIGDEESTDYFGLLQP